MRADLRLSLVLALAGTAAPGAAHAYCRMTTCDPEFESCERDERLCVVEGLPVYWSDPCVTVWVPDEDEPLPGIERATLSALTLEAFERWSHAPCGRSSRPAIDVQLGGALSCALTGYDPHAIQNVNTVHVVRDDWPHPGGRWAVALTTVTSIEATGEIVDADIELNAAENRFTVGDAAVVTDLASALTHEAGHALGLSHSDEPDATMFETTEPGDTSLRTLHADDVAGICAIYPPEASHNACPGGAGAGSNPSRVCEAIVTPRSASASGCSVAQRAEGHAPLAWFAMAYTVLRQRRRRGAKAPAQRGTPV